MESVEKVTDSIPDVGPSVDVGVADADDEATEIRRDCGGVRADAQQEIWNSVVASGLELLGKLGQALQAPGSGKAGASFPALVGQNEKTGAPELRIPLRDTDTANKLGTLLSGLGDLLKANSRGNQPGSK